MVNRFSILLYFTIGVLNLSAQKWELKRDKQGILVYTAESSSGYDMFRAEMIIHANVHGLVYLVKDVAHAHEWMKDVAQVELISEISKSEWTTWSAIGMPWPVDDRDVVTLQELSSKNNEIRIDISSDPDLIPNKEDHVRLKKATGFWSFQQLKDGQVKVTYEFESDPEGIPAWIVNMFLVDSPFNTLLNMRSKVEAEPYRSVHLPFLEENFTE